MGYRSTILRAAEVDDDLGARWDALPAGRGDQADVYDSWAWHAASLRADPALARAVRIPAVLEGEQPVALLPVTVDRSGCWRSVGMDIRPRSRIVTRGEGPDPEALGQLAESLAGAGARSLALHRLPSRDPVTEAFLGALREAGYEVARRERSEDRLAHPTGDWAAHSRDYKSFAKYVRRFCNRVTPLWDLTMDTYGTSPELPAAEGFRVYAELQARSWKGPYDPMTMIRRRELALRAEQLGWVRIFILRVAGVPVAGHVWFRLGPVATWLSTAHDQGFDALSPGTMVQWLAQERLFAEQPPGVLDYLPGGSPQKDRLTPDRPVLLEVDAVRRSAVAGVALPARQQARRVVPAVRDRVAARLRRPEGGEGATPDQPIRLLATAPADGALPAAPLDASDPGLRRYLAVTSGEASPEAVAGTWAEDDGWWRIGSGPVALARLGADDVVREVVLLDGSTDGEDVAAPALAAALDRPVSVARTDPRGTRDGAPTVVRHALLPWPAAWVPTSP
ncbi:GNAT family N-acetyltransferase [Nocardioides euryhalodurans]|uniref:GNAT family N-acetyltransferase n=1 Tax=Nocardioides euryhalodurans TaxID=2518370 RepID=A0A4P7GIT7_9ACTN|nr:GNAT family N-acetyltransferase [Nocardioides euryhalodurans]QBR91624.1 GNAT family N-acetyltransferase [Nocardioides euryhalodurans]